MILVAGKFFFQNDKAQSYKYSLIRVKMKDWEKTNTTII
jgi:hypothetical protein